MGGFDGMWKITTIVGWKCGRGIVIKQSSTKLFVGPVAWRSTHCMPSFIGLCLCELGKRNNNILIHGTACYATYSLLHYVQLATLRTACYATYSLLRYVQLATLRTAG